MRDLATVIQVVEKEKREEARAKFNSSVWPQ